MKAKNKSVARGASDSSKWKLLSSTVIKNKSSLDAALVNKITLVCVIVQGEVSSLKVNIFVKLN